MLQSFMRMSDIPMLRYIGFEKILCLLDLPDTESRVVVDLLLKKNWHCLKIPLYFAAHKLTIKN